MSLERPIRIVDLFEAHLCVSDLKRAITFYGEHLGLPLARVIPERNVAFFWIGTPGKAMLGLWQADTVPNNSGAHIAFQVSLTELQAAPVRLRRAGITPMDLAGAITDEPVVLAWMPAASVYFRDPDNNLLEFISMLSGPPRPDLEVVRWSEWFHHEPVQNPRS